MEKELNELIGDKIIDFKVIESKETGSLATTSFNFCDEFIIKLKSGLLLRLTTELNIGEKGIIPKIIYNRGYQSDYVHPKKGKK